MFSKVGAALYVKVALERADRDALTQELHPSVQLVGKCRRQEKKAVSFDATDCQALFQQTTCLLHTPRAGQLDRR